MKDDPKNHTPMVVMCITILGALALFGGVFLIWKGYQTGELYAQIASNAVSGLVGFIGGAGTAATVRAMGNKTKITNSPDDPVPVTSTEETKP